jgi:hypothetical protein
VYSTSEKVRDRKYHGVILQEDKTVWYSDTLILPISIFDLFHFMLERVSVLMKRLDVFIVLDILPDYLNSQNFLFIFFSLFYPSLADMTLSQSL